jgi:hypothetical protein
MYRDCRCFAPASSGDGRRAAERFVERYAATGSLRPGDYVDVTRNALYFIGLIVSGVR